MTTPTAIPVLSLRASPQTLATQLFEAYTKTGFAYLQDHDVTPSLIEAMFEQSRHFHALPHEQKMQIEVNRWHRGFIPINTSTNRTSSIATTTRPNQSESLMIMHESETGNEPAAYLAGPNQWPAQLPSLKPIALQYVEAMSQISIRLVGAIELALSLAPGTLLPHFESPTTFLRLLRYPVQELEPGLYGSAPHTDYGFLTLLTQDDTGGLQVRDTNGDWLDVPPRSGSFIMNAGDMLHRYSNGKLQSTPHRVINVASKERYSIAFFFDPRVDTVVSPLQAEENQPSLGSVCYGDYLRERLEKNHTQHNNTQ
jgi:isopenicillin N synthase-like dioxygenase